MTKALGNTTSRRGNYTSTGGYNLISSNFYSTIIIIMIVNISSRNVYAYTATGFVTKHIHPNHHQGKWNAIRQRANTRRSQRGATSRIGLFGVGSNNLMSTSSVFSSSCRNTCTNYGMMSRYLSNSVLHWNKNKNSWHWKCSNEQHRFLPRKRTLMKISTATETSTVSSTLTTQSTQEQQTQKIVIISESKWRSDANIHSRRIRRLLQPGLTSIDDPINSGLQKRKLKRLVKKEEEEENISDDNHHHDEALMNVWTALDGKNPIYNFLIEYYGLKGAKGPRRLARWSPDPKLLLFNPDTKSIQYNSHSNDSHDDSIKEVMVQYITNDNIEEDGKKLDTEKYAISNEIMTAIMNCTQGKGGIFLQNANENDLNGVLHLRGAIPITTLETLPNSESSGTKEDDLLSNVKLHGMLYNPYLFYNNKPISSTSTPDNERISQIQRTIAPFQWYKSILQTTLQSEPIFHCHGLHEWAMLYHPQNAEPPPSAKYQKHLPIRVSRQVINDTVERRGISCTHVDALRFFAPAAGPLNHHGSSLERIDQLKLEQKGCVHAHMDLLKIALKLQPFLGGKLLCDVLEVSIAARRLDVEASPYDVSEYGGGVVAVETEDGRRKYRARQRELMKMAEPVRVRMLDAYDVFLELAFDKEFIFEIAHNDYDNRSSNSRTDSYSNKEYEDDDVKLNLKQYAAPERFAKAEPGGKPWRKNLI